MRKSRCVGGGKASLCMSEEAAASASAIVLFDPNDQGCDRKEGDAHLTKVYVDGFLGDRLRPHQIEGIRFMYQCLSGFKVKGYYGCILCDGMGLGKSFQSIAVLWMMLTSGIDGKPSCHKPLVLCPSSLVQNWGNEFKKWLGERVVPVVMEGADAKKALMSFDTGGPRRKKILVTSYTTYRNHAREILEAKPDFLICDEAHFLKNSESQISKAVSASPIKFRLLLTGTPIQNDLSEFYAMVNIANPGILGDASEFKRKFEGPIAKGRDADADKEEKQLGDETSKNLKSICDGFLLRRGSEILKNYLPDKIEQVVFCRMSKLQALLYDRFLQSRAVQKAVVEEQSAKGNSRKTVDPLQAIRGLIKMCSHPELVYDLCCSPKRSESKRLTGFEESNDVFHGSEIYPPFKKDSFHTMHSGKLTLLEAMLKSVRQEEPTDKVVLVSNYTMTLDLLEKMCNKQKWVFLRLDGKSKNRQALVETFNDASHPSFLFLLSSKAGGVGLNIIGANRLVLFDPDWNPANDQQAMARVWREGQKKQVWIYRLLTTGSIEEKIYQRQIAKQNLSRTVMDQKNIGSQEKAKESSFSKAELKQLFAIDRDTACDTHKAIRCPCDSTGKLPKEKDSRSHCGSMLETQVEKRVETGDALDWSHYSNASWSPDPLWRSTSITWIREKYVSFLFSSHSRREVSES
ncbi:hypothetical protein BSKO_07267 [Bryopsis sp. KO-2023]|nr:hypothetical protein BSKO_07267 [Bryopsis sp. KO-2023]